VASDGFKDIGDHLGNPATRFMPLRLAIASGHGIGKSAFIGMVVNWGDEHLRGHPHRGHGQHREPAAHEDLAGDRQVVAAVDHRALVGRAGHVAVLERDRARQVVAGRCDALVGEQTPRPSPDCTTRASASS